MCRTSIAMIVDGMCIIVANGDIEMSVKKNGKESTNLRALRRLLRQHYGRRRPSADEILAVMTEYKLRDSPKKRKGRKKK